MSFARDGQLLLVALADPQADSTIAIYRVKDWTWLRALKGHKGRVNCVDAHVNGRVALSVGQDGLIRMWDLVAGKSVAAYRTGLKGERVWSPCASLDADGDVQRWTWFAGARLATSLASWQALVRSSTRLCGSRDARVAKVLTTAFAGHVGALRHRDVFTDTRCALRRGAGRSGAVCPARVRGQQGARVQGGERRLCTVAHCRAQRPHKTVRYDSLLVCRMGSLRLQEQGQDDGGG